MYGYAHMDGNTTRRFTISRINLVDGLVTFEIKYLVPDDGERLYILPGQHLFTLYGYDGTQISEWTAPIPEESVVEPGSWFWINLPLKISHPKPGRL